MSVVFLSLGSNVGERLKNIHNAFDYLKAHNIYIDHRSSIIETDPVGGPQQDKFLNTVIKVTTDLHPLELLGVLKSIERRMGRKKTVRNAPRIIDLDILLYDNLTIKSTRLTIPHPRMFERSFVMDPLHEIAPHINKDSFHANH